ncbi:alpha/beta hydrolase [Nocardioides litoris]|uniref:alpha/beta hydrolase n=1 Tax=Nocardioides litoris TaxID=1926648 RepID=UPI001124A67F|nr:alpha/beta hydrolase [Nocardioides litoris]
MAVTLPSRPRAVPALVCDPGAVQDTATRLLAASAQVDDLGDFAGGRARVGDWAGPASEAYHAEVAPTGEQADAMSLALRAVARRVDDHADALTALLTRRGDLDDRRQHLAQQVAWCEREAAKPLTPAQQDELQEDCRRVQGAVDVHGTDVATWVTDLETEEREMKEAFTRVLDLDAVDRLYGGVEDPADAALDRKPGAGASPAEVNAWWESLSPEEQQAVMAAAPGAIGNLDGIPAGARHEANSIALERDLADWRHAEEAGVITDDERDWLANAEAAQRAIEEIEGRVDPVTGDPIQAQLYLYDPAAFDGDGAVAVSAGDLDTADNVAVVTPGLGTDGQSAPYQADRAATLYESSRYLGPDETNATLFWIGYDAPDNVPWEMEGFDAAGVATEGAAEAGGARLADTVDGLRASRDGDPAHLTAIGHSYGSTTTGLAAQQHGLDVDDVVFVGSPGVGGDTDHASDLGIDPDHVWAGANSRDTVTWLGNHGWVHGETLAGAGLGDDPTEDDFGAQRFQAEDPSRGDGRSFDQHSLYFEHGTESLANISEVVNGDYGDVTHADHRHDPFLGDPEDPEDDADVQTPRTQPVG